MLRASPGGNRTERWQADQCSYRLGPEPGLQGNLPQYQPHLRTAGAYEGAGPKNPKLQDLHNTKRQQDTQEVSQCGASIESVAETRGLEPMTYCSKHL